MDAFRRVEQRVRAGGDADQSPIPDPPESTGACVTLRLSGRVIGRGTSFDDQASLDRALAEAWAEAAASLEPERDALVEERRRALAARITIDLEIAGPFQPLVGATFDAAASRLSPGLDGVAMRTGERIAGVFPGTQLATGLTPTRALRVSAGMLDLPPAELDRIRRDHDVTLYAFRTQHIAQPRPADPPIFLQRGGRYVPLSDVTGARLRAAANAIATHLATRAWSGPEPYGLHGAYHPTTGVYEPMIAGPRAQALVALALARYARTPGVDAHTAEASLNLALKILRDLTLVAPEENDPSADPTAAATWIVARAELLISRPAQTRDPQLDAFHAQAADSLLTTIRTPGAWNALPPGAKALVGYALARDARADADPALLERARAIVRDLLRASNTAQLAALMPWLGWAELELAAGEPPPSELALRDFRALAWEFQIQQAPIESPDADLSGGIVFTRGGAALPTWHTLRPLAFLATMLADPALTDDRELASEFAAVRRSLRFLLQLTVRDAELHMMRSERRSLGGVRHALWDQTQGLDANALALITLSEVLQAAAARADRPEPAPNP